MRVPVWVILMALSFSSFAQPNLKKAPAYANIITPGALKSNLSIIAGAEMEGRETATEGQRKAAAYIESEMKELGLLPALNGKYQIPYPLFRDSILSASMAINNSALVWNEQFIAPPNNFTATQSFSEVVQVNFDETAWKDEKIDVSGKLVLLGPVNAKPDLKTRVLAGRISSLMKRGAAAALIVDTITKGELLGNMTLNEYPAKQLLNYYLISQEVADLILTRGIDSSRLPARIYKADVLMDYKESIQQLESTNVIGYMEGTSRKDEFVIISAHYDHIGKKDSLIWYGADDDGSGTVSVLNIARAFAKAKAEGNGPLRSLLFIAFSGEEKGLFGSQYYSANPIFPLEKTTGALNIDMVGRIDSTHIKNNKKDYVYLVGDDKLSSDLPSIAKAANAFTQLELNPKYNDPKDPEKIYTRSDHYNFAKYGVPVIFFYDGSHPDYHRVTDTIDKIDFDLLAKRARLIFYTAWQMANRKEMLVRDKPLSELPKRG